MIITAIYFLLITISAPLFSGQNNLHTSMCFSPDRQFVAHGLPNNTCAISCTYYDVEPTYLTHKIKAAAIKTIAFSPNGRFVACGDDKGVIRVWNHFSTEKLTNTRKPYARRSRSSIQWVRYLDNNNIVVAKEKIGKSIHIFDFLKEKSTARCKNFPNLLTGLEVSSQNTLVFSDHQKVYIWDIRANRKHACTFNTRQTLIETIACHPTKPLIAVGYSATPQDYETIQIWNYAENKELSCHHHKTTNQTGISNIQFDQNKDEFAFCADYRVVVANYITGAEKYRSLRRLAAPVLTLAHDSEVILAALQNGHIAHVFNRCKNL